MQFKVGEVVKLKEGIEFSKIYDAIGFGWEDCFEIMEIFPPNASIIKEKYNYDNDEYYFSLRSLNSGEILDVIKKYFTGVLSKNISLVKEDTIKYASPTEIAKLRMKDEV